MGHRAGQKLGGSHTTVNKLGGAVIDFLQKSHFVEKITIGFFRNAGGGTSSIWRVKILDEEACVLLILSQASSHLELRYFFTSHPKARHESKLALARFVRDNGWELRFTR